MKDEHVEKNYTILVSFQPDNVQVESLKSLLRENAKTEKKEMQVRILQGKVVCSYNGNGDDAEETFDKIKSAFTKIPGMNIADVEIMDLKDEVPKGKILYKYGRFLLLRTVLEDSRLFLSPPADFNDPFDCNIALKGFMSEKERNKLGICCLSESWESAPMWAHYADNNNGICIGFDAHILQLGKPAHSSEEEAEEDATICKGGIELLKVRYKKDYPYIPECPENLKRIVTYKHINWSYEKEFRLIHGNSAHKWFYFSNKAIKEVMLGANIKEDGYQYEIVKGLLKKLDHRPKLYKIIVDKNAGMIRTDEGRQSWMAREEISYD